MGRPTKDEMNLLLKSMMEHTDKVAELLLDDWMQAETMKEGCRKVLESQDKLDNPENLKKQLITAVKTNQRLASALSRLSVLMLVYVTSDEFSSQATKMRAKTGDTSAIRDFARKKFGGKL